MKPAVKQKIRKDVDYWRRVNTLWEEFARRYDAEKFIPGKTLLELGCGFGLLGNFFEENGAIVTYNDARRETLDLVESPSGNATLLKVDIEAEWIFAEHYDIILCIGILYHLQDPISILRRVLSSCDYLVLETVPSKTCTPTCVEEDVKCRASGLHGTALLLPEKMIEQIMDEHNFVYEKFTYHFQNEIRPVWFARREDG